MTVTRRWNELGFWVYSCGCIQYQDGSERCAEHKDALPKVEGEDIVADVVSKESLDVAGIYLKNGNAVVPRYKTAGSVGMDVAISEGATLRSGEWKRIPTGLIVRPPEGFFAAIYGRSSLANRSLMLANNVGISDPDYCGPEDEIKIQLWNFGTQPQRLEMGERVAQIVFTPYVRCKLELFTPTGPSRGGYGSTGVKG